jgi:hypothetical protein
MCRELQDESRLLSPSFAGNTRLRWPIEHPKEDAAGCDGTLIGVRAKTQAVAARRFRERGGQQYVSGLRER